MGDTKEILDAIEILIDNKLNSIKFNNVTKGRIVAINDNKYSVKIGTITYSNISALAGVILKKNQIVYLLMPNGNLSDIVIIGGIG